LKKLVSVLIVFVCSISSTVSAQVQAVRDFDVYDSVGVNTHWTFGSPYQYLPNFDLLIRKMQNAGIHHFRDGEQWSGYNTPTWVTSMYTQLDAAGLRGDLTIKYPQTIDQLESGLRKYPGLESIEMMNEWDINGGTNWISSLQQMLPIAHQAGADLGVPVLGPAFVQPSSFSKLGDVSQYLTYGNVHDYQGNRNPETPGWGGLDAEGNAYGSILWNMDMAHEYAPGRPVISTETGFQTGSLSNEIPDTVEGTYAPRVYLARFKRGIKHTYMYELIDDPYSWSTYGLLHYDLSPKPAYAAIANMQELFEDTNAPFTPGKLPYTLSGNTANVETLLVQKSGGQYWLAVWLNQSIWDVNHHVATPVPPQQVTLTISNGMDAGFAAFFQPDGTVNKAWPGTSKYTFNVSSCVTLIRIYWPGK
jgi:hypothetical protein